MRGFEPNSPIVHAHEAAVALAGVGVLAAAVFGLLHVDPVFIDPSSVVASTALLFVGGLLGAHTSP